MPRPGSCLTAPTPAHRSSLAYARQGQPRNKDTISPCPSIPPPAVVVGVGDGTASSSVPAWVLLNNEGYIGSRPNATTAVAEGRNSLRIEASLHPARPPLPSNLFVDCPDVRFPHRSVILATAEDLLLIRVLVAADPPPSTAAFKDCDYFVYRAGAVTKPPLLTLIPSHPNRNVFHDEDVGVLPRGGDLFTVAALVATSTKNEYMFHRFDSEAGTWALKTVWLDAPKRAFPVKIPIKARRLNHITTTVITLGGEAGTMGWVDLWSGVLLYDLLRDEDSQDSRPMLRHMPLPVPMHAITCNRGCGANRQARLPTRSPRHRRHHQGRQGLLPQAGRPANHRRPPSLRRRRDRAARVRSGRLGPAFEVDDWVVTTWSNTAMGGSFEDWHEDFTVRGSEIKVGDAVRAELLAYGLLHRKPTRDDGEEPATVELPLHNLAVSEPTPSQNGDEDVLYLMARTKLFLPKAWALAIDMRNNTLLG
ncbi:hypothetical protein BAE44_0017408, partial [Dichanthelium oligosanthes]